MELLSCNSAQLDFESRARQEVDELVEPAERLLQGELVEVVTAFLESALAHVTFAERCPLLKQVSLARTRVADVFVFNGFKCRDWL